MILDRSPRSSAPSTTLRAWFDAIFDGDASYPTFKEESLKINFPQDCHYDRANHLWVKMDPSGQALIGIDALGLEALGDLAYIVLPGIGTQLTRAKPMGTLEAAKMTGELIAPISGTVLARNERVLRDPSFVNRDNYGDAWLVAIQPSDWTAESADLVHGADIAAWAEAEIERYRSQGWIND